MLRAKWIFAAWGWMLFKFFHEFSLKQCLFLLSDKMSASSSFGKQQFTPHMIGILICLHLKEKHMCLLLLVEPFLSHWIRTNGQWSWKIGEDTSESSTFYPIIIIKIISFVKYVITCRYFLQKRIWTFDCTWRKFTSLFPLLPFLFPSSSCVCMLVYLSL